MLDTLKDTEGNEIPLLKGDVNAAPEQIRASIAPKLVAETALKTISECPYCGGTKHSPRSDGKVGYECPECESVFLGDGTGVVIEHGVLSDINEAQNLTEELSAVTNEGIIVSGPFRGNAQLFQIPEITLPSVAGVAIAARNAGLRIQSTQPLFLIRN